MSSGGAAWPPLLVLLAAFALGGWIRFSALSARPLAVDEYYFLQSIRSILESGIPTLPGGGIYVRGWILQYVTAGVIGVLDDPILSLRLVSAVLGIGSCALVFLYARSHIGPALAAAMTVVFLLSSWQVEFSRFGRMYSGLQFVTLAFLVLHGHALATGSRWSVYGCHAVALVGLGVHQTALFFLPLLLPITAGVQNDAPYGQRVRPLRLAATAIVALGGMIMFRVPFRSLGVTDPFPADFERTPGSGLPSPDVMGLGGGSWPILVGLGAAAAVLLALERMDRGAAEGARETAAKHALSALAFGFALLHQFVPAALALAVLVVRYRALADPAGSWSRRALAGTTAVAVAWCVLFGALLAAGGRIGPFLLPEEAGSTLGAVRRVFFQWPDVYTWVVRPWASELPLLGTLFAAAVGWRSLRALGWSPPKLLREPAVLIVYFCLLVGLSNPPYVTVRYTYFVYPIALVVLVQALRDLWQSAPWPAVRGRARALAAVSAALVFFLSGDFNPRHLADVSGREQSFRTGPWAGYGAIWYAREDYESPARYLAQAAAPGEPIVVVNQLVVSYYLPNPHIHLVPRDRVRPVYALVSRDGGTTEAWSRRPLAGTLPELRERLGAATAVWFIDDVPASPEVIDFANAGAWSMTSAFQSIDGRIQVLRMELAAPTN